MVMEDGAEPRGALSFASGRASALQASRSLFSAIRQFHLFTAPRLRGAAHAMHDLRWREEGDEKKKKREGATGWVPSWII